MHKELKELGQAIKTNVKVTDKPKWAQKPHQEEELEEEDMEVDIQDLDLDELIRITVSPQGQQKIEKEADDVKIAWDKIDDTPVVQNMGNKFNAWAHSPEVYKLKALDQQFLASPEGKRMMKEWREFAMAVKNNTHKT